MKPAHVVLIDANSARNKCSAEVSIISVLCSIFPVKTAANVASLTRTNVRSVEYAIEGRNGLSGRALINLLRSPIGPKVLDAITDGAEWRACERRLIDIYELQNQLQNIEQKRRALERALVGPR